MTDLKQQLEAVRDRMAEEHFKKTGWAPTEGYVLNYQAGFNAAIPIILEMEKAIEVAATRKECNEWSCCASCGPIHECEEALDKLKQFIEINGDSIGK